MHSRLAGVLVAGSGWWGLSSVGSAGGVASLGSGARDSAASVGVVGVGNRVVFWGRRAGVGACANGVGVVGGRDGGL